jgi:hypothetical protein
MAIHAHKALQQYAPKVTIAHNLKRLKQFNVNQATIKALQAKHNVIFVLLEIIALHWVCNFSNRALMDLYVPLLDPHLSLIYKAVLKAFIVRVESLLSI